ncbi:type II restriction endonuclease, partial [Thiolapillus sp.]
MKKGYLSEYFDGVAAKCLSAVEVNLFRSNQHEFNGVRSLRRIFGHATGRQHFPAVFLYLDDVREPVSEEGFMTWYDAREAHPVRSEYRLYFPDTDVSRHAEEGDVLIIGKRPDGSLMVVISQGGSTAANQILWLFGLGNLSDGGFSVRDEFRDEENRTRHAVKTILETLGIVTREEDESFLDDMLASFGESFPCTRVFSEYARKTLPDLNPREDPDYVLLAWLEQEEVLFRTLEKYLITDRLKEGFGDDVDSFISFSLSVQNRRKSRAGHALENHLEEIFISRQICYQRGATTENRARPDFLFPSGGEYHDPFFDSNLLTMLGAKSTCKDRWRQVLSEAERIPDKHLLTLET